MAGHHGGGIAPADGTHRTHISGRDLPDQLRRGLADGGLRIDHLARIERAAPIAEVTLVVANRTPIGR